MNTIKITYNDNTDIETIKEMVIDLYNKNKKITLPKNIKIYSNLSGCVKGFIEEGYELIYDYSLNDWFKKRKTFNLVPLANCSIGYEKVKINDLNGGDFIFNDDTLNNEVTLSDKVFYGIVIDNKKTNNQINSINYIDCDAEKINYSYEDDEIIYRLTFNNI